MQKDHLETPKLRRVRRTPNASTPELVKTSAANSMSTSSRPSCRRMTIAPSEMNLSQSNVARKRNGFQRMSMLPTQAPQDSSRIIEAEKNETESMLLYDEYLQNIMIEIILKKKAEKSKQILLSQLATIAEKCDHDEEKLFKLKTREKDIINLTILQNEADAQAKDTNNFTNPDEIRAIKNTLSKLYSILQPLDVLRCKEMILPVTPEEWKETEQALKTCTETLQGITELIGSKKDTYLGLSNKIKEFLQSYNDIVDHHKKLEEEFCNVQINALKAASLSLAQNQD